MSDALSSHYTDLLTGSYDCVDRIVLNAYNPLCMTPGGFRTWWRQLYGTDAGLDTAHLMRLAGRFSRRVHAFAQAHQVPLEECARGERKHRLAEAHLADHPQARGLFLIQVSRSVALVWEAERAATSGALRNLKAKQAFVNHYSFHILDPDWGHLTIKMCGHPPFGAQIMLNGHEYVSVQAARAGLAFGKDGNCFTHLSAPRSLAAVADALAAEQAVGRLLQVCDRWIYSCCLCFGLQTDEQARTNFRYQYSVYQLEYSRNLLFRSGHQMEQVFQGLIDRTRSRLHVPQLRTMFGSKHRPHRGRKGGSTQIAVLVETPVYDLTVFKLHFGKLTLKAYTKGEHVLRFEAIVHHAAALGCGRVLPRFPLLVARLHGMVDRWLDTIWCLDQAFVAEATLEQLPAPAYLGHTRVGGIDVNKPRMRAVLSAVLACALAPTGFRVGDLAAQVRPRAAALAATYGVRQAAYDLKKLRAKGLVDQVAGSRRYQVRPEGVRIIAALVVLREQVINPLLAGTATPTVGREPTHYTAIDTHYEILRKEMHALFTDLGLAAA
jgi:hypothetical protein